MNPGGHAPRPARGRLFRGLAQAASLALFVWLLWWGAASPDGLEGVVPLFLRLDPLAAAATVLAGRAWLAVFWPALLLPGLTFFFGRLFCGWLCPLGATLDAASSLMNSLAARRPAAPALRFRPVKYLLLTVFLAAALAGVNLAYWAAPLPLATRFYGLLLHPLVLLGGHETLNLGRPVLDSLAWPALSYLVIVPRRFASMYFLAGFFGILFWLERVGPRFWCRNLCPAGALLGLISHLFPPWWRRRVSACVNCGKCAKACEAIRPNGQAVWAGECLTCQKCVDLCPARSTLFSFFRTEKTPAEPGPCGLPSRRVFLAAALGGLGLAGLERSGLASLLGPETPRGLPEACLRPPGALPEADFLARCLRCGLCLRACPTNGLQPAWLAAGPEGVFSPVLRPRRGPCEPDCRLCGQVCPTRAITSLEPAEKRWAKIGGAVVHPNRCLAWGEGKSCVVCQEVCPYGAIESVLSAQVPAPRVKAAKCFGCGYCEHYCPVRVSAITVLPLNALRLARGSYIEAGRAAGLDLDRSHDPQPPNLENGLPPGFSE